MRSAALAGAAIVIGCAAGCGGSHHHHNSAEPPASNQGPHVATLGESTHGGTATVDVESGVTSLDVSVAHGTSQEVVAATPTTSPAAPSVTRTPDGVVHVQLAGTGSGPGTSLLSLGLSPDVTWTIDLDGGATTVHVDMTGGKVAGIDFDSGVSHASITVPEPTGTTSIIEAGGASSFNVNAPKGTPTRVAVAGGASSVTIGTTAHTGVAGGSVFTAPSYGSADNRVDIELHGGVSSLSVSG